MPTAGIGTSSYDSERKEQLNMSCFLRLICDGTIIVTISRKRVVH